MQKIVAGLLLLIIGLALVFVALMGWSEGAKLLVAVGVVSILAGTAVLMTLRRTEKTPAVMRLHWFLPFSRSKASGAQQTRRGSWLRKTLKQIGPSVVASPLRRAVQLTCLALFLTLLYYVCWPYTAQPQPPGQQSAGWALAEIDQESGAFLFSHPQPPAWVLDRQPAIHVVDETAASDEEGYVGAFEVTVRSTTQVALQPVADPTAEQFDRLVTSLGAWRLCEQEPGQWPAHYADDLVHREFVSAELFLLIDPLVSVSTAIAARSWIWSLSAAAVILIVCVLIPRGFCGYICPLGTTIDLFDWSIARRVTRFQVGDQGWWVHIKYYLLASVLVCAACGVLVSGFFAAIPVLTRGLVFLTEPVQTGLLRGWHLIPYPNVGHIVSVVLFFGVFTLGFLRPRFWCRYVCPSGAMFSLGNLFRVTERKVESSCIHCNKCIEICPFDAIKPDFTTRATDCTFCQSCGGVCPTDSIKFVERWNRTELKAVNDPPTGDTQIGRRGFLSLSAGSTAALVTGITIAKATKAWGGLSSAESLSVPVRPPGSVPEPTFLQMCIRCGECFKVCPNNVLQAEGFQQGLDGLWTPLVVADWAGCESSCNACGQVCPTGAIRNLPLEEKRVARMGLAIVQDSICLPYADREPCQLCVDECNAAGYKAIEFMQVHTRVDSEGLPVEGTGYLAPVVSAAKCVGCGLCQTRCHGINVKVKGLLDSSAIVIQAGPGKEDRLMSGSYLELRAVESRAREQEQQQRAGDAGFFVPDDDNPNSDDVQEQESTASPFD